MMGVKQYLVVGFLSLFVLLAGCGGGDSGGATADGSDLAPGVNIISFVKTSNDEDTKTIPTNDSATVLIRLLSSSNQPIANEIVTVSVTSGTVTTPALTNVKGETTFIINPPLELSSGTETGVLTVTYKTESTKTINYEFVASGPGNGGGVGAGVNIISFVKTSDGSATASIPTNDTATVSVRLLDTNNLPITNEIISASVTSGAVTTPALTDVNGDTSFTIMPPSDLLTGTQTGVLTVEYKEESSKAVNYEFVATNSGGGTGSSAGSIAFVSATPESISLKGTGGAGRQETSTVVFKVLDSTGQPLKDETVNFKLSTNIGGLALSTSSTTSNASGEAATVIQAGSVATPVTVTAFTTKLDGTQISTSSSLLTVSTGIPDQNSISLSQEFASVHAWERDNETVDFTVRLSDRFNNPAPDGTIVQFTTEGGQIEPSCEIEDGVCSVEWRGADPRPADGRAQIMAYTIGNEYFADRNGNGVFDDGDVFTDQGEAFRDDDESGTYNPAENNFAIDENLRDYDGNGLYSGPDGKFNGVLCQHSTDCPDSANNIGGRSNLYVNVVEQGTLIMASGTPSVRIFQNAGTGNCINSSTGHIDTVNCTEVSTVRMDQLTRFNIVVEDERALCTDSNGNRVNGVVSPTDPNCTILKRQSIPTDSTLSAIAGVGEIVLSNNLVDAIPFQYGHHEFSLSIQPSNSNAELESGTLEVEISLPTGLTFKYGIILEDAVNVTTVPDLGGAPAQVYTTGVAITELQFANSGGELITTCAASPALPAGLSVSVTSDANSCRITGTPTSATALATYTITATNALVLTQRLQRLILQSIKSKLVNYKQKCPEVLGVFSSSMLKIKIAILPLKIPRVLFEHANGFQLHPIRRCLWRQ